MDERLRELVAKEIAERVAYRTETLIFVRRMQDPVCDPTKAQEAYINWVKQNVVEVIKSYAPPK